MKEDVETAWNRVNKLTLQSTVEVCEIILTLECCMRGRETKERKKSQHIVCLWTEKYNLRNIVKESKD